LISACANVAPQTSTVSQIHDRISKDFNMRAESRAGLVVELPGKKTLATDETRIDMNCRSCCATSFVFPFF
jgi:hypothetical protein